MSDRKTIVASFDLDGVVFDFPKSIAEFGGFEPDLNFWDMGLGDDFRPIYERYVQTGQFRNGEPLVDSAKIRALRDMGVKVTYTTARSENCRADTQGWLDEHGFVGTLYHSDDKTLPLLMFNHNHHEFYGIDDNGDNAVAMDRAGMRSYLVEYGHNADVRHTHPHIAVVQNTTDFCYIVAEQVL